MVLIRTFVLASVLLPCIASAGTAGEIEPTPVAPADVPSASGSCLSPEDRVLDDGRAWGEDRYSAPFYQTERYFGPGSPSDVAAGFSQLQPLVSPVAESVAPCREPSASFALPTVKVYRSNALFPFPLDPNDMLMDDARDITDPAAAYGSLESEAVARFTANVNLALTYDTGAGGPNPSSIVLDSTTAAHGRGRFDMLTTSGNLKSDFQLPSDRVWSQGYAEAEFDENSIKLRQIYGRIENLLSGSKWTVLGDEGAIPHSIINNMAPAGAIYLPSQVQLTYAQMYESGWTTTGSMVRPNSGDIESPVGGAVLQRYPDLIGQIRYQPGSWQGAQVAALLRPMGIEEATGNEEFTTGWAVSANAGVFTYYYDNIRVGVAGGQGLGSYLFGLSNNQSAAFADASGLHALSNFGYYAGYQHYWSSTLTSNLAYGFCKSETIPGTLDSARSAQNAWINLIWIPVPNKIAFGFEYQYGFRDVNNGVSGDNHHIQLSIEVGGQKSQRSAPAAQYEQYASPEFEGGTEQIPYNRSRRI
jgi:hypothetical protein